MRKAKLHRATVTEPGLNYAGPDSVDAALPEEAEVERFRPAVLQLGADSRVLRS